MALQVTITENIRLVGDVKISSYVKVLSVSGGKNSVTADVLYIKDNKDGEFIKHDFFSFTPDMNGGNFIQQAYQHLKSLPDFSGAVDC